MNDDTTGESESSDEEFADVENTDTEEENPTHSFHYAARAEGFRRGRHHGYHG